MANYYASARSNYFRVKDDDAFLDAMTPFEVEASKDNDGRWLLIDVSGDANGWPFVVFDEATDEYEDIHFPEVVAPHLADGEVCILMEVGREKLRYLSGYAIAFNNKGEEKRVSLNDIYELATDLGTNITDCTY